MGMQIQGVCSGIRPRWGLHTQDTRPGQDHVASEMKDSWQACPFPPSLPTSGLLLSGNINQGNRVARSELSRVCMQLGGRGYQHKPAIPDLGSSRDHTGLSGTQLNLP